MELEYIANGIRRIYGCIGILILCVLDWHLNHMCAFGNWFEMLMLGNFHVGFDSEKYTFVMVWTYFHGGVLMKYDISFELLEFIS